MRNKGLRQACLVKCNAIGMLSVPVLSFKQGNERIEKAADFLHSMHVSPQNIPGMTQCPVPVLNSPHRLYFELETRFPEFAEAMRLYAAGDLFPARLRYLELVAIPALSAASLHQLALIAAQCHEYESAAGLFSHSLRFDPSCLSAYVNLAQTFYALGNTPGALNVLLDYGGVLQTSGLYAEAEAPYREILSRDPLNYGAYVNLGTCLACQNCLPEAIQKLLLAFDLYGRLDSQVSDFAQGLRRHLVGKVDIPLDSPLPSGLPSGRIEKIADAVTTLGKIMSEYNLLDEALLCHRFSIVLAPMFALAHWNLSLALLAKGAYPEGWREYEWRWRWEGFPERERYLPMQPWRGEPLDGKRILVWAEQGFGDTIQFVPMVSRLAALGAKVRFEVMAPLARLFAWNMDGIEVVSGLYENYSPLAAPTYDFAIAQISLPSVLGLSRESLPIAQKYLKASPDDLLRWAQRIPCIGKFRVGIVFAGRALPDKRRTIPFRYFLPLFDRQTVTWYSLQVGPQQDEIQKTGHAAIENLADGFTDFAETAAAMAHLDLILTIDTATAHLAAAMGRRVWLLLPWISDWRWRESGQYSSWYPSLRIFRQQSDGEWESVIEAVDDALEVLLSSVSIT